MTDEKVTRYMVSGKTDATGRVELRCPERFIFDRFMVASQPPVTWHDRLLQRVPRFVQRLSDFWPPRARYLRRLARTIHDDADCTVVTSVRIAGKELLPGPMPMTIFWPSAFPVRWSPIEWGGDDAIELQFEGNFLPVAVCAISRKQ